MSSTLPRLPIWSCHQTVSPGLPWVNGWSTFSETPNLRSSTVTVMWVLATTVSLVRDTPVMAITYSPDWT